MLRAETTERPANGPATAERARTLAYGVADGALVTPGVPYAAVSAHVTDKNGRPLLLMPAESPVVRALVGRPDLAATLRISDLTPVPLPDRLRGRAWLHGRLTEIPLGELRSAALRLSQLHPRPELLDLATKRDWTVLALEVAQVEIDDQWGNATLDPEEYAAAAPDPFVAVEGGIITHLDSCHRDELIRLLPASGRGEHGDPVRPLALDRYGLWLRRSAPPSDGPETFDVRLAFPEPVSDLHGLRCGYRRLFAAATP